MLEAERRKAKVIEKMKISEKIGTGFENTFQGVSKLNRKSFKISKVKRSPSPVVIIEGKDTDGLDTCVLSPRKIKDVKKRKNELLALFVEAKRNKKKYAIEYDILKRYQNLVNYTPEI